MLNLPKNGGLGKDTTDINLLFAASGDLRNVVRSLIGLPEEYNKTCTVVINDHNSTIVVRNILLLLIAYQFEEYEAVPMMIHLWYSAFLPKCMVEALQKTLLPRQLGSKTKAVFA
jgi:hypothetical protein